MNNIWQIQQKLINVMNGEKATITNIEESFDSSILTIKKEDNRTIKGSQTTLTNFGWRLV